MFSDAPTIKMQNLIVDPEFFIENMDVLPSIPVCRFVCKNGKENTALMMKLANYPIAILLEFNIKQKHYLDKANVIGCKNNK